MNICPAVNNYQLKFQAKHNRYFHHYSSVLHSRIYIRGNSRSWFQDEVACSLQILPIGLISDSDARKRSRQLSDIAYFTVYTLQTNCSILKKIVISHCLQSSHDVKLCTHILTEMMVRLFTSRWFFSTWLDGRSTGSWISARGGAKRSFAPLEIGTKNQTFLENLKSEA